MRISEAMIWEKWVELSGHCECIEASHRHSGRCGKKLSFAKRNRTGPGGWSIKIAKPAEPEKPEGFILCCNDCCRIKLD